MYKLTPDSRGWYCGSRNNFSFGVNYAVRKELYVNEALHYHADLREIYLVVSGSLVLEVEGKRYKVLPSEMYVVEPMEKHQVVEVNDCGYVVVQEKSYEGNKIRVPQD